MDTADMFCWYFLHLFLNWWLIWFYTDSISRKCWDRLHKTIRHDSLGRSAKVKGLGQFHWPLDLYAMQRFLFAHQNLWTTWVKARWICKVSSHLLQSKVRFSRGGSCQASQPWSTIKSCWEGGGESKPLLHHGWFWASPFLTGSTST